MKKIINILTLAAVSVAFTSCDDLFEPAIENNLGLDYMYENPQYAEGVLGNAYTRIPCADFPFSEVATDDAVSNDATNDWRKIASGTWTSNENPSERWRNCRAAIMYLNLFLANADKVNWANDEMASRMFNDREKGEAYGMRAMYMYYLLQAHGGMTADGQLLGVPIVTEPEDASSEFNLPRNTFAECLQAIYDDCDRALELLPTNYKDIKNASEIPSKYQGANVGQYNRVFGANFQLRMSGAIVEAFRSKAALLAASPAFEKSGATMAQAADYAAVVLDRIGGVAGMDPNGWTWYCNNEIDALSAGQLPKEILWRGEVEKSGSNDREANMFPPSLYGKGRINPTQNFVNAFPMANGYPIDNEKSGFNAANPYADRDPRLTAYVVYDGNGAGKDNTAINTTVDDSQNRDGLNNEVGSSTRTGYYMRKLLRQEINLDPSAKTTQKHYNARIRFTEIFLNYAEAANEAWGPTGKGNHSYSAYDIIKALHERAGVGNDYLESIKNDKDKMREMIRNERRIELSFEGFRFWDLRRWKANLTEPAKGISIKTVDGKKTYTTIEVDKRDYKDYMIYGPVPYSEMLKFDELKQNQGW